MRTVSGGPTSTPATTPARSGRWNAGPAPSFTSRSITGVPANPVREARHARPQRAHRPDEKVDLRAVLRSGVQGVDDLLVDQVVDLDGDPTADHRLPLDELCDRGTQVGRRDEELAITALPAVAGQ